MSKSCFYLFINGLKLIFVLMKYELFVLKLMVNLDFGRGLVSGRQVLGRMYMGRIGHGAANLQTDQSVNVLLKNVLQGLRVVDSASPAS